MSLHGSPAFLECSIVGSALCDSNVLLQGIEAICGEREEFEDHIWELVPSSSNENEVIDRPILLISRSSAGTSRWLESASASDKSAMRTSNVRTVKRLMLLDKCAASAKEIATVMGMKIRGSVKIVNAYSAKHFSGVECVVSSGKDLTLKMQAGNQAAVAGCEAFLFQFASSVQDLVSVMNKGV